MATARLDPELVQGFRKGDPLAEALILFVAANSERPSSDIVGGVPSAASYINPLDETWSATDHPLIYHIDATDPDDGEHHAFSTRNEFEWHAVMDRLDRLGWEFIPGMAVVVESVPLPSGLPDSAAHIRTR